jgi:hypothetical protein
LRLRRQRLAAEGRPQLSPWEEIRLLRAQVARLQVWVAQLQEELVPWRALKARMGWPPPAPPP